MAMRRHMHGRSSGWLERARAATGRSPCRATQVNTDTSRRHLPSYLTFPAVQWLRDVKSRATTAGLVKPSTAVTDARPKRIDLTADGHRRWERTCLIAQGGTPPPPICPSAGVNWQRP